MAFNIPAATNLLPDMSGSGLVPKLQMPELQMPEPLMPKPQQFRDIRITKMVSKSATRKSTTRKSTTVDNAAVEVDTVTIMSDDVVRHAPLSKLDLAAEKIKFSTALLRSYGKVYESLGGRLAHDSQGMKIYGDELLEIFQQVREQVHEGHPIQDAMKMAFEKDTKSKSSKTKSKASTKQAQPIDKKKLNQLLENNAHLSEEIEDLRRELKHLKKDKKDKSGWLSKLVRVVY